MTKRIMLVVLDGWGLRDDEKGNAVRLARTPNVDRLWDAFPHTTLDPSGLNVGLPDGLMGNSEVGHLNLGAGRIVYQDIVRISKAIEDGEFFTNEALVAAADSVSGGGALHLMGLVSTGGVHSLQDHIYALVELARRRGVGRVFIHAFLDGRDTAPRAGTGYLSDLQSKLDELGTGKVATVMGRYFAMDRDKRWDRIRRAYDALTVGAGSQAQDVIAGVERSYAAGVTDEFVEPIVAVDGGGDPVGSVEDGDAIIFFNFRADRARQITRAFTERGFDEFEKKGSPKVDFTCMTEYDSSFSLPVAFPPVYMKNILAEVAAGAGKSSLRIAETEKYAHVTYFFNGGREKEYAGEERILIPSPRVATYDLKPDMSAGEVTDVLIDNLKTRSHDYIVCNFANPDMVGHTGVVEAAVKAVETVDSCVGRIMEVLDLDTHAAIITSDHGNAETMIDGDGGPHTAHTANIVPCILVDKHYKGGLIERGTLKEIAPTMCRYMGIEPPAEMTGKDLRADG